MKQYCPDYDQLKRVSFESMTHNFMNYVTHRAHMMDLSTLLPKPDDTKPNDEKAF